MAWSKARVESFSQHLRDLLAATESTALIDLSAARSTGLGEHLSFGCTALRCDGALALLELTSMRRLHVPVVASRTGFTITQAELDVLGTPLVQLFAGGPAFSLELTAEETLRLELTKLAGLDARYALLVPLRSRERVVGALACLRTGTPFADADLDLGERLGRVLAMTVEVFFTEKLLYGMFAHALPSLLGGDAQTNLPELMTAFIRQVQTDEAHRRSVELSGLIGRLAARGEAETRLVTETLRASEKYLDALEGKV